MGVQKSGSLPNAVNRLGTYDLEEGSAAVGLEAPLTDMGYKVNVRGLNSGPHAIEIG